MPAQGELYVLQGGSVGITGTWERGMEPLRYEMSLHPCGAKSRFSERAAPDPDEIGHHKGLYIPGSLLEI